VTMTTKEEKEGGRRAVQEATHNGHSTRQCMCGDVVPAFAHNFKKSDPKNSGNVVFDAVSSLPNT